MLTRRCLARKMVPKNGRLLPLSGAGCPDVPFVDAKPRNIKKITVYPKVNTITYQLKFLIFINY